MNTTNVTATVRDLDGQTWNNGSFSFTLYNPTHPAGPFTNGGVVLTPAQLTVSGNMNAAGLLSTVLFDVSQTQPFGSVYLVTLGSNTSAPAVTAGSIAPAGASQDYSGPLSANLAGPRMAAGPNTWAYSNVEILTPLNLGAVYFNVLSGVQLVWNGTTWLINGSSGGGANPVGPAGGDLGGSYPNPIVVGSSNQGNLTTSNFSFNGALTAGTNAIPGIYVNQGATQPTNWNANGTEIGINASTGFLGNYIDCRLNGSVASFFSVNVGGTGSCTCPVFNAGITFSLGTNWQTGGGQLFTKNRSDWGYQWSSTTSTLGATDTVLSRSAAGILQINSGTTNGSAGSLSVSQIIGGSVVSTIAAGPAAGTGATATIAGSNLAGQITLTTGTATTATGVLATITFGGTSPFGANPKVVFVPANAAAAAVTPFVAGTASGFLLNAIAALTASTQYVWNYIVIG